MGKKRGAAAAAPVFPFPSADDEPRHFSDYGFDDDCFSYATAKRPAEAPRPASAPANGVRAVQAPEAHFQETPPQEEAAAAPPVVELRPSLLQARLLLRRHRLRRPVLLQNERVVPGRPALPRRRRRRRRRSPRGVRVLGAGHAVRPPRGLRARRVRFRAPVRHPQGQRRRRTRSSPSSGDAHLPRDVTRDHPSSSKLLSPSPMAWLSFSFFFFPF